MLAVMNCDVFSKKCSISESRLGKWEEDSSAWMRNWFNCLARKAMYLFAASALPKDLATWPRLLGRTNSLWKFPKSNRFLIWILRQSSYMDCAVWRWKVAILEVLPFFLDPKTLQMICQSEVIKNNGDHSSKGFHRTDVTHVIRSDGFTEDISRAWSLIKGSRLRMEWWIRERTRHTWAGVNIRCCHKRDLLHSSRALIWAL